MNSSGFDNNNGGLGGDDSGRLGLKFDNALNGEHLDPATVVHRRPSALAMRRGTNISPYRRSKPTPSSSTNRTAPRKFDTPPSLSAQGYGDGTSVNRSPQGPFGSTSQNYGGGFQRQNTYGGYPNQQPGFGSTNLGNSGFQGQSTYGGYPNQQPGFGNTNLGNSGFQGQSPYGGYPNQQPGFGNTNLGNSGFQGQNPYGYQGQQPGFGAQTNTFGQTGGFGAQTNIMGQTGGFGGQNNSPFSGYGTNSGIDRREGSLSDVLLASRRSSNPGSTLGGGTSGTESGDVLEPSAHLSPAETYAKLMEESQQERNSWRGFVAWFNGGGKYTVLSFIIVVIALSAFALFLVHRINSNNESADEGGQRYISEPSLESSSGSVGSDSKQKQESKSSKAQKKTVKKAAVEEDSPRAQALKSAPPAQKKAQPAANSKAKAAKTTKPAPAKKVEQPKPAPAKEEIVDDEPVYYGEEGDDSGFHMDDNDFAPSVEI